MNKPKLVLKIYIESNYLIFSNFSFTKISNIQIKNQKSFFKNKNLTFDIYFKNCNDLEQAKDLFQKMNNKKETRHPNRT